MLYITLGNMRRFLDKLKTYIGNNYLKLTGGTVTGAVRFNATPTIVDNGHTKTIDFQDTSTYGFYNGIGSSGYTPGKVPYLVRVETSSGMTSRYRILDESNYRQYAPSLDGSGATGTWPINISGNALNDSEGNKIVDTYVKKSEAPTAPDLTEYMKKSADSSLDMKDHPIYFGYAQISLNDGFAIDGTGDRVKIFGTSLFFNNSRIDTREDNQKLYAPQVSPTFTGTVTAPNVTVSTSLTIPGGKIWIA